MYTYIAIIYLMFEVSNNYGMKSNPRFLICFNVETLLVLVMTMMTT